VPPAEFQRRPECVGPLYSHAHEPAITLATSLVPDRANENPFFTEGPRRIFAHLEVASL
jgi:hypothetical protein